MWINQQGGLYSGDCQPGDREATPAEVAAWEAARNKTAIQWQIDNLEAVSKIPRVMREFMLGSMEREAAADGMTLEQLRQANIGYKKLKDLDLQIRALRAQL